MMDNRSQHHAHGHVESATSTSSRPGNVSEDDFMCICCYEILLDPTTLPCGHTFCRYCLANWWDTSNKSECLQCRKPFSEFPSVNFTLRNTIERLFPNNIKERRKAQSLLPNYANILKSIEDRNERLRLDNSEGRRGGNINCYYVLLVLGLVLVVITLAVKGLTFITSTSFKPKTIIDWTPTEVADWVGDHGVWAKGVYEESFLKARIDGKILVGLKDADLMEPPISMHLSAHRRALLNSIKFVYFQHSTIPDDFWKFKYHNPGQTLFLLFGMKRCPRTLILYLYFFDYQHIFLPFLNRTIKPVEEHPTNLDAHTNITPTWEQLQNFFITLLVLPYYLVGVFAAEYTSINYWISRVAIIYTIFMTGCELTQIGWLFKREGYKTLPKMFLKQAAITTGLSLVVKVVTPFIPTFLYDILVSWMLCISPFEAFNRFFRQFGQLINWNNPQQPEARPEENRDNRAWHFNFQIGRR